MKQIILKELREQYRVALVGMLIFSAILAVAFAGYSQSLNQALWNSGYMSADSFQPLMKSDVLVWSAFACGVLGTLLGWLQIRAEKHPDLWAFLVHRPIERVSIFNAKVIAGLLLYLLAAGIPVIGFEIWCIVPGHVAAPFAWPMLLPLLVFALSGIAFYFGGLLTGIRKARWYGSQGIGVACAIGTVLIIFNCKVYWQALSVVLLAITALGLAARGSYLADGHLAGQSRTSLVSLCVVSVMAMTLLSALVLGILINNLVRNSERNYAQYSVIKDGRIIKVTRKRFQEPIVEDLKGNPILDPATGRPVTGRELNSLYLESLHASVDMWKYESATAHFEDSYWYQFTSPVRFFAAWQINQRQLWFLGSDGRLVSYDGLTRLPGPSIVPPGTKGAPGPDDSRFLLPFNFAFGSYYGRSEYGILATARTVYRVDTERARLTPLLTTSTDDPFLASSESGHWTSGSEDLNTLLLSEKSIRVISKSGTLHINTPYSPSFKQYPTVDVSLSSISNRFIVQMSPYPQRKKTSAEVLKTQVSYITAPSTVAETTFLPESNPDTTPDPGLLLMTPFIPLVVPELGETPQERPWHAVRFVLAGAMASFVYNRARKEAFSNSRASLWGAFVLVLGLPAFLTFYALQEFATRQSCPKCNASRRVDQAHCRQCESPFATPPPTGTEIFEALPVR